MEFRTGIEISKSSFSIGHQHRLLFMGSCFSENIGQRLTDLKFNLDLNPFGVIFNPASIAKGLELLLQKKTFVENELFFQNDCWNSYMHHSRFSANSIEATLENISSRLEKTSGNLKNLDYLILTFGTAWVFIHKSSGQLVANCHKTPASEFERRLLNVDEIVNSYKNVILLLRKINPELKIIYTISPVRHLKDGAQGNQISKSILHVAVSELMKEPNTFYFPSYELMMDDLRDYRFYAEDMVHPSKQAIDYIFEKFSTCFFDETTQEVNKVVNDIKNAINHKPSNIESAAYKNFLQKTLSHILELEARFPFLTFQSEKQFCSAFFCK